MTLVSCSDDSNSAPPPGTSDVPQSILAQFSEDYPDARDATWSLTQDGYYTVEFSTSESARNTSWYDKQGRRDMAQHEIFFDQLPDAVRDGFAATEYGQTGSEWRADREVDVLKRRGSGNGNGETGETLYIIEVEGPDGTEVDLYFTADGILVQEVVDAGPDKNYGQYLPQAPAADMKDWLDTHFPGYRLIDIEGEDGGLEVEFVFDRRKYEAFFGPGNQWLYYKTELHYGSSLIPDVVKATVEASELMQQGARVDEVEMYVVNDGGTEVAYFCFELETRFDDDRKMYVRADGTEDIIKGDERIALFSLYQETAFPFGLQPAQASNIINAPMPEGSDGTDVLRVVNDIWIPKLLSFKPELILVSAGFDAHRDEKQALFKLTEFDYSFMTIEVMRVARAVCGGRLVSILEGGYDIRSLARSAVAHITTLTRSA